MHAFFTNHGDTENQLHKLHIKNQELEAIISAMRSFANRHTQKTAQKTSAIRTTMEAILMTDAVTSPDECIFYVCNMGPSRHNGGRDTGGRERERERERGKYFYIMQSYIS